MTAQAQAMREHIRTLISDEISAWVPVRLAQQAAEDRSPQGAPLPENWYRVTLRDFCAALCEPQAVAVTFSGGLAQECWAVTRPNGPYQVVYMPAAGYFSLCVQSQIGPLDIGVHGDAISCFGSI